MATVRRNYKDSLFCHLFGDERRKEYSLELYNALAGTDYRDPDDLELNTIADMVFLGFRNDVSFLVGDEMVMLEHQSTRNKNMPLRGLLYLSRLYAKLVDQRELDLYSTARLALPAPRFYVLYFGLADEPDRQVLRLSDSFPSGSADLEVTATVLNCNEGRNGAILGASEALRGYAHLLALARRNRDAGMEIGPAVSAAVDSCIDEGALAGYLSEHRAEAKEMLWTMEDEERMMTIHWKNVDREAREHGLAEGRKIGMEQGRAEGRAEGIDQGLEQGLEGIVAKLRESGVDEALLESAAEAVRAESKAS